MYRYVQNIARGGIAEPNDMHTLIDAAKYPPKRQYQLTRPPTVYKRAHFPISLLSLDIISLLQFGHLVGGN